MFRGNVPEYTIKTLLILLKFRGMEEKKLYESLFEQLDVIGGATEKELKTWIGDFKNSSIPEVSEEKFEEIKQKMINYSREVSFKDDIRSYVGQLCEAAGFGKEQIMDLFKHLRQFVYLLDRKTYNKYLAD